MVINNFILSQLTKAFNYELKNSPVIVFAVRGALPSTALGGDFSAAGAFAIQHSLTPARLTFAGAGCTIGLWRKADGCIAVFPGSTLPSSAYLDANPEKIATCNILCPGHYLLRKGIHPRSSSFERHEALLMDDYALSRIPKFKDRGAAKLLLRGKTEYRVILAGDNLHAARNEPRTTNEDSNSSCLDMLQQGYSSSGCITICGQPVQYLKNKYNDTSWNCWQQFQNLLQDVQFVGNFSFLLFEAADFIKMPDNNPGIRYGSSGSAVLTLQHLLANIINLQTGQPYYSGSLNSQFTHDSVTAALELVDALGIAEPKHTVNLSHLLNKTRCFRPSDIGITKQLNRLSHAFH